MNPASLHPQVTDFGFELYFLAAVSEEEAAKMPDPNDLDSVGNREWLWQGNTRRSSFR